MAAGFTVARDMFAALSEYVNKHAFDQLQGQPYAPELRIDSVLSLHALTIDFIGKLSLLAPYGAGHAEPRFALTGVKIIKPRVVGENHVSCFLQDTSGGASLKGIAFRAMDSELGELLLKAGSAPLHLAGHVSINEWNGKKTIDFQIVDAAPVWG
jgi:single-stranded-DNA-specific exonuclease